MCRTTPKLRPSAIAAVAVLLLVAAVVGAVPLRPTPASAGPAAATACPPQVFVNDINLAKNPSFEYVGVNGTPTTWNNGDPVPAPSAAARWYMHSSNGNATVTSALEPTNVPGPGGSRMLHFIAGGNEGGVYQLIPNSPAKLMFSVWVKVRKGHVAIQPNGGASGPVAWSTKLGEWEQLRVCTDGTVPTDALVIYNQDPAGGDFYIDRVEARQTP